MHIDIKGRICVRVCFLFKRTGNKVNIEKFHVVWLESRCSYTYIHIYTCTHAYAHTHILLEYAFNPSLYPRSRNRRILWVAEFRLSLNYKVRPDERATGKQGGGGGRGDSAEMSFYCWLTFRERVKGSSIFYTQKENNICDGMLTVSCLPGTCWHGV